MSALVLTLPWKQADTGQGWYRDQDSLGRDHGSGHQHCRWQRARRDLRGQRSPESLRMWSAPRAAEPPRTPRPLAFGADVAPRPCRPRGGGRRADRHRQSEVPGAAGRAPHGTVRQRTPRRPGRAVRPEHLSSFQKKKKKGRDPVGHGKISRGQRQHDAHLSSQAREDSGSLECPCDSRSAASASPRYFYF